MTQPDTFNRTVDDDVLLAMAWFLASIGLNDHLGGGVATTTLATHLPWNRSTISNHCSTLVTDGEMVRVSGVAPPWDVSGSTARRARPSYLPVGHPNAPDRETRDGPPRTLAEVSD